MSQSHPVGLEHLAKTIKEVFAMCVRLGHHPTQWAWNEGNEIKIISYNQLPSPSHTAGLKHIPDLPEKYEIYLSPSHAVGLELWS